MDRIYAGNLPFSTTDEELRALFSQHSASVPVADASKPREF